MDLTEEKKENAIAVAAGLKSDDRDLLYEHLEELELLAETAGAELVEKVIQILPKLNPKTVIGKGKIEEIREIIENEEIKLVIFDYDLSPAQLKNLENAFKIKVIDRSGLILDIFAKNAKTIEAKTQVELAQSQYLLTRLTRMWTHLSKQFGGIGTKGPGETQIETDRRILKNRITKLKEKLTVISLQKEQQKKGRKDYPRFALVGYTNAGKSTLMNAITEAEVYIEDKLFATLDTTVRAFSFENGQKGLLSDTVGFIRKLPTHLIASFRSTLAEAKDADVLIHVVDINNKHYSEQIEVVNETLDYLKISDKPQLLVFNKIDLLEEKEFMRAVELEYPNSIFISSFKNINTQGLLKRMQDKYDEQGHTIKFILPYKSMNIMKDIYTLGDIKERKDLDEGIYFELRLSQNKVEYFDYLLKNNQINLEENNGR